MNSILQALPYMFVYLDDILVASCNSDEHLKHLCVVFEYLQAHSFIGLPDKCACGLKEIPCLGHLVSKDGIGPLPLEVDLILRFPCPSDSHGLSKFLGLVNYYHQFVPSAAKLLSPLY